MFLVVFGLQTASLEKMLPFRVEVLVLDLPEDRKLDKLVKRAGCVKMKVLSGIYFSNMSKLVD